MKKNHKKIDLNELHKTQLEMLKEFDQLCNDNNLTYFLTGGTLLGSVRHQGFIPWDDDIDLGMPREDYIKLQKIFEKNDEKYFLQHFDSDPYFGIPISKLRRKNTYYPEKVLKNNQGHKGVFIDIFPWDYIPKNIFKKIFQKLLLKPLKRMVLIKKNYSLTNKEKSKQILNGILKMVSVVIPTKMLIFSLNFIITLGNKNPSNYYICTGGVYSYKKETIPVKWTENKCYEKFEDEYFPVIYNSREYLKQVYGDFMKIPEKIDQKSHFEK